MLESFFSQISIQSFLFLSIACFIGTFIDAIAGGGGLICVPAYIASGLPIHVALGSNKMSGTFSTLGSSLKFITSGKVNFKALKPVILSSFLGASMGVCALNSISEKFLAPIVVVLLFSVVIYTYFNKDMGISNEFTELTNKIKLQGMIWSFLISFYIGFFGPGGGSFLIFAYIKIYKFDFTTAAGNAKIINLTANLASLIIFIYLGKIAYLYAIPLSFVSFLGSQCGAKYAIKKGAKFIRPVFLTVSAITTIKMLIELF